MPILKENRKLYPKNWKEISANEINLAGNRCQFCGVHNHAVGYRDKDGEFIKTYGNIIHDFAGNGRQYPTMRLLPFKEAKEIADICNETNDEHYIVIVLTVAHLDHNPENNKKSNLKALCQRCHNRYYRKHRNQTIKKKRLGTQLILNF